MRRVLLFAGGLGLALASVAAGFVYVPAIRPVHLPAIEGLASVGAVLGRARHAVLVIVDGARRADFEALAVERPGLVALRQRAARFEAHAGHPSISRPMYATLGSGASPRLHGVTGNAQAGALRVRTLVDDARAAGLVTLLRDDRTSFWWDLFASPPSERVTSLDELHTRLRAAPRALALVHLLDPDEAAHAHGAASTEYTAALRQSLRDIERIASALDLERDVLLVTADHGHRDRGGHGGQEPDVVAVPLWIVGRGVRPGVVGPSRAVDVAPTLAVLLGLPVPAHAEGRPLFEGLSLDPGADDAWAQAWLAQRWRLSNAILLGLGETPLPAPSIPRGELALRTATALVSTYEERVDAAYARRDIEDRRYRTLAVTPLFLFAAFALYRWRRLRRALPWALATVALGYAIWAPLLPFTLSAVAQKGTFYLHLGLVGSLAADLGALAAWAFARRGSPPDFLRDVGVATVAVHVLELAVVFAWFGISVGRGLPEPEGFVVPALALSRTAVVAILWGCIVPNLRALRRKDGPPATPLAQ